MRVVSNERELKDAISSKETTIKVVGDYANKIQKLAPLANLSGVKKAALIALLVGAIAPTPTKGVSMAAVTAVAGKEIAIIIFSAGVSISLIIGVLKGYKISIRSDGVFLEA